MLADIESESLAQLLTTLDRGRPTTQASFAGVLQGDVVEIQGGPSSGKTHLLYRLILDCIYPIHSAKRVRAAIVLDMDHRFDIIRLNHLLVCRITRSTGVDKSAIESIAQQSLKKLHLFRPSSTLQLAVTVSHLAAYHSTHLPDDEIGLVGVDSMSFHYWPDRFIAEQMRTFPLVSQQYISHLQHALSAIRSFSHSHHATVVMTNWGLHSLSNSNPSLYRQHLHPFPTIAPDHHVTPRQGLDSTFALQPETMLQLTCQITLHSIDPSLRPCLSEVRAKSEDLKQHQVHGLMRRPHPHIVNNFLMYIGTDDIFSEHS